MTNTVDTENKILSKTLCNVLIAINDGRSIFIVGNFRAIKNVLNKNDIAIIANINVFDAGADIKFDKKEYPNIITLDIINITSANLTGAQKVHKDKDGCVVVFFMVCPFFVFVSILSYFFH